LHQRRRKATIEKGQIISISDGSLVSIKVAVLGHRGFSMYSGFLRIALATGWHWRITFY
jgi:hypothetical protein